MSNRWLIAAAALAAVLGVAGLTDLLVVSDEERLAEVATAVTHGRAGGRIDALLAYADVDREPAAIGRHRARDAADLDRALRDELGILDRGELEVVQTSSRMTGETGRIALRVRSEGELVDAELTMRRDGQGWLLSAARRL